MTATFHANNEAADVIVVGGGLMGASAAFFLRKRGRSVILLERGLIGQQASGVNFGNVRRQGRYLFQLPLANRAREIWGKLPQLVGEDCEFLAKLTRAMPETMTSNWRYSPPALCRIDFRISATLQSWGRWDHWMAMPIRVWWRLHLVALRDAKVCWSAKTPKCCRLKKPARTFRWKRVIAARSARPRYW
jgi:glycine/D-amino acid oxidase-like deaminating enzyme